MSFERASIGYRPPLADVLTTIGFATGGTWPGGDRVVIDQLLCELGRLAADVLAPSDAIGDEFGARLTADGSVTVAPEVEKAHHAFVGGGWSAVAHPAGIGGGGLGSVVGSAVQEINASSNLALSLNTILTNSAVELLRRWGTASQQARFLRPLVSGLWSGTMALTEADAGSDVGALRTAARRASDGTWRVSGSKIFITWGEHELTDNIIHFVLARAPGSPDGTKGISLYLVPKVLPDGRRNAVFCDRLERKLGIHSSPTCQLRFDNAEGELVGTIGGGMTAMFSMMNPARLAIAVQGLATGERAMQQALSFALQRRQGSTATAIARPVPIAAHPDVRRMLADLRSTTRAMRVLLYRLSAYAEQGQADGDDQAQRKADLLTPIAKSWCTDEGFRLASLAMQVHGGIGYIEDAGVAQRLRDSRIGAIYEGTNGIQAVDLVSRKLTRDDGAVVGVLLDELWEKVAASDHDHTHELLLEGIGAVHKCTRWLLSSAEAESDDALAGASAYLHLVGTVVAGLLLTAMAHWAAVNDDATAAELAADARFFVSHKVAAAAGTASVVMAGARVLPVFV